ncbi:fumarylacetoacetate hydrolase family protein [Atopococcus tabaci]|uniref:fumarylacetoacetate hydrolase family protein n=1 Tax=Atopococcus tabaci TaxID=269774 RepID=UPI000429D5CF|nr:fumarylacetoacetate hydrolase family protein [Atopococcus tabaci]
MTLKPGDVIFTGTPEGVVLGYPEEEREWLKPGETLEVSIENIGVLKNTLR